MVTESTGTRRFQESVERSQVLASIRRASDAIENSHLAALADWLVNATTHSFLYRWLTKEPEPEIIVIDLRDTVTVGPIIAVLDRLVAVVAPLWRTSALRRATDALAETAAETRTGRTIAKLLEPPEE